MRVYRFEEFLGKKVLIEGDVGSGKTALTAELLRQATQYIAPSMITVIDMAPSVRLKGRIRVGGRLFNLVHPLKGIRYLRPRKVWAPRLDAGSRQRIILMSKRNAKSIGKLLDKFLNSPTPALFVNDLTMYLHAGSVDKLLMAIEDAETFVGNAYDGKFLAEDLGSGITRRERELIGDVEKHVNIVINL